MRSGAVCLALGLATASCSGEDFRAHLEIELSEIVPTVAEARWCVGHEGAEETWLEVEGGGRDLRIPAVVDDQGDATATVLGMKAGTGYDLRVVEVVGGEELRSEAVAVETGDAPNALPVLEGSGDGLPGYVVTSISADPSAAVIIDADGAYVWWHRMVEDWWERPLQDWKREFVARAAPTWAGDGILYQASSMPLLDEESEDSERVLLRVAWDGTELQRTDVRAAHHDFVELPDSTVAYLRNDTRFVDDKPIDGDCIVELGPDGEQLTVWSIWDHEQYDPDVVYGVEEGDWTHCNALDHDPDEDVYYLGCRHLHAISKVDRAGGEVLWRLGGERSDFTFDDPLPFSCQHQFHKHPAGMLVFDNRCPDQEHVSRVVDFELDEGAGRAEQVWSHEADPGICSYAFGDVERLPAGAVLITWSTAGRIDLVTADGEVLWQVQETRGTGFGYAMWVASLYR